MPHTARSTYSGGIFLRISDKSTNSLTGICSSVMIKSQAEIVAHDTIKHKDKTEPYTAKTIRPKERGPMKKHSILTWFCLLVSLLVLLAGCTDNVSSTPETLCGTYTSGDAELQKIFSVDQSNVFYYADQKMTALFSVRSNPKGRLLTCSPARTPTTQQLSPTKSLPMTARAFRSPSRTNCTYSRKPMMSLLSSGIPPAILNAT